jgi:hypothetical protein
VGFVQDAYDDFLSRLFVSYNEKVRDLEGSSLEGFIYNYAIDHFHRYFEDATSTGRKLVPFCITLNDKVMKTMFSSQNIITMPRTPFLAHGLEVVEPGRSKVTVAVVFTSIQSIMSSPYQRRWVGSIKTKQEKKAMI